jgi:hypothetical protein
MHGRFGGGGFAWPIAGTLKFTPRDPVYVPATVTFEGRSWQKVGFRFRGNATLAQTWRAGKTKLPFRLDFDELEQADPSIAGQRFYGFKALALMNNWGDASYVREKVADDLFRAAGVPAPRAAFYRLFLDLGRGPVYAGLYTVVEIPGKPMLGATFGDDGGNLYKPDGEGAKFDTSGKLDRGSFEKKTNEQAADFRDVEAVFAALKAPRGDAAAWRRGLERVFAVDGFLRWLAVNTMIENWDTYGVLAHNYYLYGVPGEGGRLHWIAWDHNNAWNGGFLFWSPRAVDLGDVGADWPLVRGLLGDEVYRATYFRHVSAFVTGVGNADAIAARMRAEHALIAPYVVGAEGETPEFTALGRPEDFTRELASIVERAAKRQAAAQKALGKAGI